MADKAKDLSSGTLVESVSASATSLKVFVGNGSNATIEGVWPATPFYITVMPPAPDAGVPNSLDSEIMQVSAVGNDGDGNVVLTVSRAQRGTTAQAFTEGAIITNASYAEDAVLNSGVKSGVNNAQTELRDKDGNAIYPKVSDVESSELESVFERELRMLVPTGTAIGSSKDLNTLEFLKVGRYYCSANATVATLTNCPTGTAFMMEVFSPLSTTIDNETTGTWVYRTRLLTTFNGQMYVQSCNSDGTANNWSYGGWRRYDVPGVKSATAVTHTDYNNNQGYIPAMSFLSFWNGAYNSSNNSNLKYLANGCIGANHFNNWSTQNTSDTWVPVANGNNIYHRVIKAFNSDGSIPSSALNICTSTEVHFGTWHLWFFEFSNNTSGWKTVDLSPPSAFRGKIKHVSCIGLWGNSGDNRLGAWINYNNNTQLRLRIYQATAGSNAWSGIAFAYY